ncbi:hypothetical protein [Occultella kanbiaonis]|uniref:hypothetical protein n=1 Tax=Occultella kanbiaonis TaxID=2675754 RepID=UPI0013D64A58|nr:hypothetical protein [Occultella kanbiaonis]
MRAASDGVDDRQARAELLEAVDDLRAEASSATPDTGAVVKKAGRLRAAASSIGIATLSSAVGGAVEAFTSLAVGGAFG